MTILNLKKAAEMVHMHPETLRLKAKQGNLPGYQRGRRWYFFHDELIQWIKSGQSQTTQDKADKEASCPSNLSDSPKEAAHGITHSPHQTAKEYANLLGLKTKNKRPN